MALTDPLTGLYNRRYFEVHLQKVLQTAKSTNKSFGLLYMDIDHFKKVNDTYGHNVGDEVLKIFAGRLKDGLRSFDLVARLGGEEFVAILPEVGTDMSYIVAERLRRAIAEAPFACSAPEGQISVTSSFGGIVVDGTKDGDANIQDILKRADDQLYKAKHDGRNCVYFENKGRLNPDEFMQPDRSAPQ